jgi:hypothetical protein
MNNVQNDNVLIYETIFTNIQRVITETDYDDVKLRGRAWSRVQWRASYEPCLNIEFPQRIWKGLRVTSKIISATGLSFSVRFSLPRY